MNNRASLTITDFFKACGLHAPEEVEEYNVYKKLVNIYIRDNKIPIRAEMNVAFNFPISVLRKVLLCPTDKVSIISTKDLLAIPDDEDNVYLMAAKDGAMKEKSDITIIHLAGDVLKITLVEGVGNTTIYNHVLDLSMAGMEYGELLKLHPKKKLTYRFKVVWLRKFINYLRSKGSTACPKIEDWIVKLNIHKAPMSMTIDTKNHLRMKIKPNDADSESLDIEWLADDFLNSVKAFNTQQEEILKAQLAD